MVAVAVVVGVVVGVAVAVGVGVAVVVVVVVAVGVGVGVVVVVAVAVGVVVAVAVGVGVAVVVMKLLSTDLRKDLAADAESLDGLPLDDARVVKTRKRIARQAQRKAARIHPSGGPRVRLTVLNAPLHLLRLAGRAAVFTLGVSAWWAAWAWCWGIVGMGGGV